MCSANVDWSSPDDAFQILTVLSQLPLAICLPSELKQTLTTRSLLKNTKSVPIYKRRHSIQGDGTYLCPARVHSTNPVSASHTTTSLPSARASLRPHFEYETLCTAARARIVNRQRCELGLFSQ